LRAFISTDVSLETSTILEYYSCRWCIETFFAQSKDSLGFGKYQIRSAKGIKRFLLIISLASFYFISNFSENLGEAVRIFRQNFKCSVDFC
jgi:hypothetical protein